MAGAYPNVPSRRMAYDADGSVMLITALTGGFYSAGMPAVGTPPTIGYGIHTSDGINDESIADDLGISFPDGKWFTVLFPEKREFDGIYASGSGSVAYWSSYSTNTTNGHDGTWTTTGYTFDLVNPQVLSKYRTDIGSLALSNVRGFMMLVAQTWTTNVIFGRLHLYGTITPGETPDRLTFLDTPNADAVFTKVLDYGDVPRGQTSTRKFKVKNNSSTKQANTVQVTAEDLYLGAGSWYTFSDDDVSYQATYPVGNLGTGATKLLWIKQIIPDAQGPGPYVARIKANQASWT